jgi:spermidine synthase
MLLPLAVLPIALPTGWIPPATSNPTGWTLAVLVVMVGAPYFALSTASPTLQYWFAHARNVGSTEPYMLYAAGNAGSVLALLSYPLLIEPGLGLQDQAKHWAAGYVVFLVLLGLSSVFTKNAPAIQSTEHKQASSGRQKLRWVAYAAIPSVLLLGVTRHIGDEIASFPLLWIIPLTLYLITFIVAFGNFSSRTLPLAGRIARLLVIPVVLTLFRVNVPLGIEVVVHLSLFTALALVLHQRLYDSRPAKENLTEFYVFLSLGGALGGMFVVLLAPVIFDAIYEYPLAIAVALLALPRDKEAPGMIARIRSSRIATWVVLGVCLAIAAVAGKMVANSDFIHSTADSVRLLAGVAGVIAYMLLGRPRHYALVIAALLMAGVVVRPVGTVLQDRSFFGVLRVQQIGNDTTLVHGTTIHGSQRSDIADIAQGYYHAAGPAGATIAALHEQGDALSMGLVGLGVGALAAAGEKGDELVFYEIDPEVANAAANPELFTYLSDSKAKVSTVIGDGRLSLHRLNARHDVLVIDAFSGDAIPVHLITREAFKMYGEVTQGGPILLHVSNRHLNLPPVVGATAKAAGLNAWLWEYDPDLDALATGATSSRWTLLTHPDSPPPIDGWEALPGDGKAWTDDYSNILSALNSE